MGRDNKNISLKGLEAKKKKKQGNSHNNHNVTVIEEQLTTGKHSTKIEKI